MERRLLFLAFHQGLAGQIDVSGAHGEDKVAGLGQLPQAGGHVLQGGAELRTGDLGGQVGGGDAQGVLSRAA